MFAIEGSTPSRRQTALGLAWLAVSRRKKRTILAITLLSLIMGSSITISSTVAKFPFWISVVSSSVPDILLAYQRNSTFAGLLPMNSTIPDSDLAPIQNIDGVVGVTPLIIEDKPTSLSGTPSLIVGLDVNFWQLGLGLKSGHWPQPNSTEVVIIVGSNQEKAPSSITIGRDSFQVVGVAVTSNLVLIHSVVMSYSTAQRVFLLHNASSILLIQVGPRTDQTGVQKEISSLDPQLATTSLTTSAQIVGTVSTVIAAISNAIVLVTALFTFAVLAALTALNINSRKWEYGLFSTYGGRASALWMMLLEDWFIFALAIIPAGAIGVGVLAFFTYYFNYLFGASITGYQAVASAISSIANLATLINFGAAFVAATLGALVASRTVVSKKVSELLAEAHS